MLVVTYDTPCSRTNILPYLAKLLTIARESHGLFYVIIGVNCNQLVAPGQQAQIFRKNKWVYFSFHLLAEGEGGVKISGCPLV